MKLLLRKIFKGKSLSQLTQDSKIGGGSGGGGSALRGQKAASVHMRWRRMAGPL